MLWLFQNVSFSSPSARNIRLFSSIHCDNQFKFLQVKCEGLPMTLFPRSFKLWVHIKPPEICQLQFRFSYPFSVSQGFYSWVSAPVSCDELYSLVCLSNFRVSCLPRVLPALIDSRRVTGFSVFFYYYFLLAWSVTFKLLELELGNWNGELVDRNPNYTF